MPHWYWEKRDLRTTPSQLRGLDYETEVRYRREGARFIMELGKSLNLRHDTMASAAVYFHRFYMFHTFQEFPRYVLATCCLFLAGKAEETPKKGKDLIRCVRSLTNDRQFATFGVEAREEIMVLERVLLQTIKFDLQVDHPYQSLIRYAKCLRGDNAKLQKMVQMSWTFVNDSLCTPLCLQWEPEVIAIALMYLAAKLSKFEVRDWSGRKDNHKHWWDQYVEDLDVEVLEDICHQVLDLYSQPTQATRDASESPPPGAAPPRQAPPPSNPPPPSKQKTPPPQPRSRPQTPPPAPPPAKAPPPPLPATPPMYAAPPTAAPPAPPAHVVAPPAAPPAAPPMYNHPPPPNSRGGPPPPRGQYPPYQSGYPPGHPPYQQPGYGYPPPNGPPQNYYQNAPPYRPPRGPPNHHSRY